MAYRLPDFLPLQFEYAFCLIRDLISFIDPVTQDTDYVITRQDDHGFLFFGE